MPTREGMPPGDGPPGGCRNGGAGGIDGSENAAPVQWACRCCQ